MRVWGPGMARDPMPAGAPEGGYPSLGSRENSPEERMDWRLGNEWELDKERKAEKGQGTAEEAAWGQVVCVVMHCSAPGFECWSFSGWELLSSDLWSGPQDVPKNSWCLELGKLL